MADVTSALLAHYTDASQPGQTDGTYCSDNDTGTYIQKFSYVAIDYGAGNAKTVTMLKTYSLNASAKTELQAGTFYGSNDSTNGVDGSWTSLTTLAALDVDTGWDETAFANTTAYRWYKIAGLGNVVNCVLCEWEMWETAATSITADPIISTVTILGSVLSLVYVTADPIVVTLSQHGRSMLLGPVSDRNPELDMEYDCGRYDGGGNEIGKINIPITILGTWLNVGVAASPISIAMSMLTGAEFAGETFSSGDTSKILIALSIGSGDTYTMPTMFTAPSKANFVKWSNIGEVNFTIGRDNVAGERPMNWKGWVYGLKKLGGKVVAYGQNGVSFLLPYKNTYGLQEVYGVGLKGKHAFCGTENEHYFVDKEGRLFKVADTLLLLDYSEFLNNLGSSVVMSLDEGSSLIYICDGIYGYVYSIKDKSLGVCPPNITGYSFQSGTSYVCASSTITSLPIELCTDIYDMGTRKGKTIYSLEFGTEASNIIYASIDYRNAKTAAFSRLQWARVNPDGVAVLPCYGVEFMFRMMMTTYEAIELDYIKVNGVIHNYSYLDTYSRESTQ